MHIELQTWAGDYFHSVHETHEIIEKMRQNGFDNVIVLHTYMSKNAPATKFYGLHGVYCVHEEVLRAISPIVRHPWTFQTLHTGDPLTDEPMYVHTMGFRNAIEAAMVKMNFEGACLPILDKHTEFYRGN